MRELTSCIQSRQAQDCHSTSIHAIKTGRTIEVELWTPSRSSQVKSGTIIRRLYLVLFDGGPMRRKYQRRRYAG